MKKLLIAAIAVLIGTALHAQYVLIHSDFYRIGDTQFGAYSVFHSGSADCYPQQARFEVLSNDTVYLKIIFETRFIVPAVPCDRSDTVEQTIVGPGIHAVNVSSGIVRFDPNDPMLADTVWSIYDSTFAAIAGIGDGGTDPLYLVVSGDELKVTAPYTIDRMTLIDLHGRQVARAEEQQLNVAWLSPGMYLLQVVAGTRTQTVRWYKE